MRLSTSRTGVLATFVLGGALAGPLYAQFPAAASLTRVSTCRISSRDYRAEDRFVAVSGFHALAKEDRTFLSGLQSAERLDGMPLRVAQRWLFRADDGKCYLVGAGEDGECFGVWECVKAGKSYRVPWDHNGPFAGCFRVLHPPAEARPPSKREQSEGLHLVIQLDPVGAGVNVKQKVFCDLRDDSPERKDLLEKLWTEHGQRYAGREVSHHGPDHPAVLIGFERNGRRFSLESWHAVHRRDPKIVATATGLTSADGAEDKQKRLDKQPAEYRQFVDDFDAILAVAEKLVGPFDL